jgi:hypothetical protein
MMAISYAIINYITSPYSPYVGFLLPAYEIWNSISWHISIRKAVATPMACPICSIKGREESCSCNEIPCYCSVVYYNLSMCNSRFIITKLKQKCSSIAAQQRTFVTGERILTCERTCRDSPVLALVWEVDKGKLLYSIDYDPDTLSTLFSLSKLTGVMFRYVFSSGSQQIDSCLYAHENFRVVCLAIKHHIIQALLCFCNLPLTWVTSRGA